MTDHDRREPAHLDDEELSSYMDWSDGATARGKRDVEEHLERCGPCGARLASLRAARSLVATPVIAVSDLVRDHAVESALTVWDARADQSRGPDDLEARRASAHRWYRNPRVVAGAAAVLVAVAVGVPLAVSRSGFPTSSALKKHASRSVPSAAGVSGSPESASGAIAAPGSPVNASGGSLPAVPSLGSVDSRSQLVTLLREKVSSTTASQSLSDAAAPSAFSSVSSADQSCVEAARTATHGGGDGPGIVASATYEGHKALVMEFWPTSAAPPTGSTVVAVVATDGCKLLTRTTL